MRTGCPLEPLIHGAEHEAGRRAGTENVIFAVGLGKACEVAQADLPRYQREVSQLRDLFWQEIEKSFGDRSCSTVIPNSGCRILYMSTSEVSLALSYWRKCRLSQPPQALPVMPGKSPCPPFSRRCIFPQNWGWAPCATAWGGIQSGRRSSKR